MAKTTAPLFSLGASGSVGKTLTFSKWHGRAYVRMLVIPLNPQTTDQVAIRNAIRAMAAGVAQANISTQVHSALTLTDKLELAAVTPSEFAWNGFATEKGIGANKVTYDAAAAAYEALAAGEKTAWVTAAAARTPAYPSVAQGAAGGGYGTSLTAGAVYFHWIYALYAAGLLAAAPGATPPTYA